MCQLAWNVNLGINRMCYVHRRSRGEQERKREREEMRERERRKEREKKGKGKKKKEKEEGGRRFLPQLIGISTAENRWTKE